VTKAAITCRFRVRLTPRAARDEVRGVDEAGALLVRVSAPPVDGAANDALVRVLARELGIARSEVVIASGQTARVKRLVVTLDIARLLERWPGLEVAG
jgi:uncharacterized protein (TIGR00251 family)